MNFNCSFRHNLIRQLISATPTKSDVEMLRILPFSMIFNNLLHSKSLIQRRKENKAFLRKERDQNASIRKCSLRSTTSNDRDPLEIKLKNETRRILGKVFYELSLRPIKMFSRETNSVLVRDPVSRCIWLLKNQSSPSHCSSYLYAEEEEEEKKL